jgi:drug/metabolite transporter (DMT)-like permease
MPGTRPGITAESPVDTSRQSSALIGILCGIGAALFWAIGFTAIRHGIDIGLTPVDLTFHRCVWGGFLLLPLFLRGGATDLTGVGWKRGIALSVLGGPGIAILSYSGFLLVPLGHAGVIQPSCAALFGILLAAFVLKEPLTAGRILGALTIVAGLAVIGGEALTTIGAHGVGGDLIFVVTGAMFAAFGMLLRLWRIDAIRATVVVSVLSLVLIPIQWATLGFHNMIAHGLWENLLQAVVQGVLSGPGAIYLFTRSVVLLGAVRAAVFPSLVPGFTLLVGFVTLGIVPTIPQLLGFAIVLYGFRLTQKS